MEQTPQEEVTHDTSSSINEESNLDQASLDLDALKKALSEAENQVKEKNDAWLRSVAESENIRKRATQDLASAKKFALESFASELLAVMDSLDAALAVTETTLESYRNGVELTARQLKNVFEKFHLTEINPVNEKFDPNRHQAIAALEHGEVAPNTVLTVMQKGFAIHERVLRPALVTVSKAKES
ncbi:protein GrpE [Ferrovum sp. JA12]|uniref:nucleotide exchange factor GrpE n=1 Tax=Ferrovum sp. JA12 TaxID=1356299 RepID=UPI000715269D|nr:nucleotide exchange factor GrpE [Ferrovum sp. JA12]KRH78911.1 protein GrpE [Ferrovum sp. JA12]HQT81594.1 nucleotide exchange factor GrpE [Ferrovaceae bacterium]HQU06483.1 nucleotide exchange factor GrpE [Ferrovaceae bacterium]